MLKLSGFVFRQEIGHLVMQSFTSLMENAGQNDSLFYIIKEYT